MQVILTVCDPGAGSDVGVLARDGSLRGELMVPGLTIVLDPCKWP